MIRAALFDMDGVLFDTENVGKSLLPSIIEKYNYAYLPNTYEKILGTNTAKTTETLLQLYGNDLPVAALFHDFHESLCQLAKQGLLPVKKGAIFCLQTLKKAGFRTALVTSTARPIALQYFQSAPALYEALDLLVCGDEVTHSKPAPEIYLTAAKKLSIQPNECIGIEDSLNGLKSVTAAGMTSIMVPDILPYSNTMKPYVSHCIDSLEELPALLTAWSHNE